MTTRDLAELPRGFERRRSRLRSALASVVAVAAFGGLGYTLFTRSVVYYRTPTEVLRDPGSYVRLSGTVVDGSITTDVAAGTVAFDVTDGRSIVPVLFNGAAPATLRSGGEAVAEGTLDRNGTFIAQHLFARCPSKFQTATPGP